MVPPNPVTVGPVQIGRDRPLALIAGPCVMEPGDMTLRIARHLVEICGAAGVPLIFKASFDKANRTSGSSYRGPGLVEGMKIFAQVKAETGLPVTTDLHETSQAMALGEVVDLIQVPAFLARQTDLLEAAAADGPAGQRQERAVHGPVGHDERRDQADRLGGLGRAVDRARHHLRLRPACQRLPRHPADAVDRRAGRLRRHAFGAASQRRGRGHGLFGPA